MSELKPCPLCGAMPEKLRTGYMCSTLGCALQENTVSEKEWNTRPIEDALNKRIAELEAAERWIPVSERLPDAYEKVIALAKDCMNVDWVLPKELREVGKGAFARLYNVTHWMPLPSTPEVQE